MTNSELIFTKTNSEKDAEAIRHFEEAVASGKNWYIALLESIGLWTSTEEIHKGRTYRYLIEGEAFDWLLLVERLCQAVDGLPSPAERDALIFQGKPPLQLSPEAVRRLIGPSKYRQYLNYFYGVTLEGMMILSVQEEVQKEWHTLSRKREPEVIEEAHRRIYGLSKAELLLQFRQVKGYPKHRSITLTELKEFTYWLFKYRLNNCEKAKVASDTKKSLSYLKRQWAKKGFFGALATDEISAD